MSRERRRGRGATVNLVNRFEPHDRTSFDDGWGSGADLSGFATEVREERARRILARNTSPDIGFDRSINPYRGCEHGCVYCFARPTHAFLGLSPGLDFETRLTAKVNAADALERELSAPGYEPRTIALGTATDPYQPIETRYRLTRRVLEVLERANHPVAIVTKSSRVLADADILTRMADKGLVKVFVSVTTLDRDLSRRMEPRAATPEKRLETIAKLHEAGIRTGVVAAPMIPALNDHELETILRLARDAGAAEADYVLLRLPHELKPIFRAWLMEHYPDRLDKAFNLLKGTRGGREYDADWATRMKGSGPYAYLLQRRFEVARKRLGLDGKRMQLRTDLFTPPARPRSAARTTLGEDAQLALL
ncbi:MAG: PA0069 family radical SAM protein [Pseudomonadota bacterium]